MEMTGGPLPLGPSFHQSGCFELRLCLSIVDWSGRRCLLLPVDISSWLQTYKQCHSLLLRFSSSCICQLRGSRAVDTLASCQLFSSHTNIAPLCHISWYCSVCQLLLLYLKETRYICYRAQNGLKTTISVDPKYNCMLLLPKKLRYSWQWTGFMTILY